VNVLDERPAPPQQVVVEQQEDGDCISTGAKRKHLLFDTIFIKMKFILFFSRPRICRRDPELLRERDQRCVNAHNLILGKTSA